MADGMDNQRARSKRRAAEELAQAARAWARGWSQPRLYWRRWVWLALALAAFCTGWRVANVDFQKVVSGGFDMRIEPQTRPAAEVHCDLFASTVAGWNAYLKGHDGYLPADPYALIEHLAGVLPNTIDEYGVASPLPIRVNRDLARNPKWPMFWHVSMGEIWCCYADGTWAVLPGGATPVVTPEYMDPRIWRKVWRGADVPRGATLAEYGDWVSRNRGRLQWNEKARVYELARNPGGR